MVDDDVDPVLVERGQEGGELRAAQVQFDVQSGIGEPAHETAEAIAGEIGQRRRRRKLVADAAHALRLQRRHLGRAGVGIEHHRGAQPPVPGENR